MYGGKVWQHVASRNNAKHGTGMDQHWGTREESQPAAQYAQ